MDLKDAEPVKLEIRKFFVALFFLVAIGLSYYFYIRHNILSQAQSRAEHTLVYTNALITERLDRVEAVVDATQSLVEYALDNPENMYDIVQRTVESDTFIKSAAVAFKDYHYPQLGRWYEPVAASNSSDTLIIEQIGGESHDYTTMEWYTEGLKNENGVWSDPYSDPFSKGSFLMTYSKPIFDTLGQAVGVICADISIVTIAQFVEELKLYPHSFCTLATESGAEILPPPDDRQRGPYHSFIGTVHGKNIILTIYVPYSDMYWRLRKLSLVFVCMAVWGMAAFFFIARRYLRNLKRIEEVRLSEQRIEDELAIARNIQKSLLPAAPTAGVDVCGKQLAARYVGGDLYDYYLRDGKLLFCIGDVSGKGIPAALLMAIAHSLFRTISANSNKPDIIMHNLNKAISDNNPDIMFITMFLGVIDLSTGRVDYCNAGHNPPILVKDGRAEYLSTEPSLLLGVDIDAEYTSYGLTLAPGDTLFLYTDGLTEAENEQKELFGEKRTLEVAAQFNEVVAARQIEMMTDAVSLYVGEAEQSDDLTLLAIRVVKQKKVLTLTNDLDELAKLQPFLEETLAGKTDSSLFSQLSLAVEEAVVNVIMYAYPDGRKGEVAIALECPTDGFADVEISDSGVPFNPLEYKKADLETPLEDRPIGGLGIHLVKEIMDTVDYSYTDGHNVLHLRKKMC